MLTDHRRRLQEKIEHHKGVCAVSQICPLTGRLGLPPAPSLFDGAAVGGESDLTFLDVPDLPAGDALKLYPFQQQGVDFLLSHQVSLLGDEMGLGKSIQAIAALRDLLRNERITQALILCPKTLIFDWYYKLRLWAPGLRVLPVEGPRKRRVWYWRAGTHVTITGYETWREDVRAGLADSDRYDLVILDEIQRIKNPETATHRAVASLRAPWRWGLSGTPLENRVEDLVAIFSFLKPGLLPTGAGCPSAVLRQSIAPYLLRRRKDDVLKLPPKEHRTVWLELSPQQRIAYEAAEQSAVGAIKQAGHAAAPMIALALLTKLKQICNLDPGTGDSAKLSHLTQELDRLQPSGEKALIFSQYPEKTLKPLLPRLERYSAALFDGSLSDWNRQLLVHRFQHSSDPRTLAISLKCGGVGITLTRATRVFHYDHWWNPAAAAQAEDRAHRIGQERPVTVTTLLTRGTVEERIAELIERKRDLFREVMDPLTDTEASDDLVAPRMLSRRDLLGLFGVPDQ